MSKLYIEPINNGGTVRYGLFYDAPDGSRMPHKENREHAVYDTMEEAQAKLDAMTNERVREDEAEPFTLEEAEAYAERHKWRFATTYADRAPHEYLVKAWLTEDDKLEYERFVQTLKTQYVVGYFHGHKNHYLILGGHYYWFMGQHDNMAVDLINRTVTDFLEFRDGAYHYRPLPPPGTG